MKQRLNGWNNIEAIGEGLSSICAAEQLKAAAACLIFFFFYHQ